MLTNTPISDTILGSEREADFLLPKQGRRVGLKSNRFSLTAEMRPFLLEADMESKTAEYIKKYKEKAYKERPWLRYLHYARSRCHNKTNRYTQRGIKVLIIENELKELWFRDKAWLLNKPSLDRIDGRLNYTFENCRFIEWKTNLAIRSIHNYPKVRPWERKPILQLDLNGNLIKKWESLTSASKGTSLFMSLICRCLKNGRKTTGGYIWKYANL